MAQAHVYAKLFFKDDNPDEETLGQSIWMYEELANLFSLSVQKGIVNAFGKGK